MFRLDFLCKNNIVVEVKAVGKLTAEHKAQLFNYMRLLRAPCGIIVNFAPRRAEIERYLYDSGTNEILTMDGNRLTHAR